MSEERPSFAPGLVLAQVSLRVILPLVGGVLVGLVVDNLGGTAPQFTLIGLAAGTLVSILWLGLFVSSNVRRIRHEELQRRGPTGSEEHEHGTTESA